MMKIKDYLLFLWNFWPPFFGAGIKIDNYSKDYRHMEIRLKLRFWNSNYVGTQYGGSMFSMTDPFYMVMLLKNLGSDYIVWDKAASIRYIKPGKTDVRALFHLDDHILSEIKNQVELQGKYDWNTTVKILDKDDQTVAEVQKTLYIKKKQK